MPEGAHFIASIAVSFEAYIFTLVLFVPKGAPQIYRPYLIGFNLFVAPSVNNVITGTKKGLAS